VLLPDGGARGREERLEMRLKDLTGQRFGRLTVLRRGEDLVRETLRPYMAPQRVRLVRWHCRCDCGREVDVLAISLRSGGTRSCGCLRRERLRERNRGRGNGGTSRTPSPTAETEVDE
jgi:hypothetical protein